MDLQEEPPDESGEGEKEVLDKSGLVHRKTAHPIILIITGNQSICPRTPPTQWNQ